MLRHVKMREEVAVNRIVWITALCCTAALWAQDSYPDAGRELEPPSRVARLSYLDGTVSFQPAGTADWVAAQLNRPLTTGDRLYTEDGSRAELHTGTTAFRVAPRTGVNIDQLDDRVIRMIVTEGTVSFRVKRLDQDEIIEVDTPNAALQVDRPGEYRVNVANPTQSEAIVLAGELTVNQQPVGFRQAVFLSGPQGDINQGPPSPRDGFDQWVEARDRAEDRSQSARYVPGGTIGYEDLDANGTWANVPPYGMVWEPRTVVADWAPYRFGHWVFIEPWGWTWVDDAPWGFAPFHYGRWAYVGTGWGWIPGPPAVRAVYAPALVSFHIGGGGWSLNIRSGAPVSWVPLGPGEVWVPGFRATPGYWNRINVNNTVIVNRTVINNYYVAVRNNNTQVIENVNYVNRTVPGGMTTVPRETFTRATRVQQAMVSAPVAAPPPAAAAPAGAPFRGQAGPPPSRQSIAPPPSPARMQAAPVARPVPEPSLAARLGAAERAPRPPEHIAQPSVRPQHLEHRDSRPAAPQQPHAKDNKR
jgi:hypothetical protein